MNSQEYFLQGGNGKSGKTKEQENSRVFVPAEPVDRFGRTPRNAHKGDARFRELVILRLCHFAKTMRQKSKLAVAQTVDFWRITQNART